ncbi:MAG: efflux RND transporter periplasmic adaptor subunit, partial [Pacificimonas sp.]
MRFAYIASVLALLSLVACSGGDEEQQQQPPTVSVALPLQREVRDWDEYIGRFEAEQDAELRPRVSGQIDRIYMQDGDDVSAGQPLLRIDPRPYRAAVNEAQAAVSSAEAASRNAVSIRNRARGLREAEAISQEEFEENETAVRTATADVEAAKATLATRQLDLNFTTIRAPISGRVSEREVSIGDFVTAGTTPLTRIVTLDPIRF